MKKSAEILGLPVVSIVEGKELGIVSTLVIDANNGSVSALTVDDGKWYLGARLLPFTAILGIGESAVIINNCNDIVTLVTAPEYEKLLEENVEVIGTNVLNKNGRILGKVTEINIDDTGKIASCEIEESNGQKAVIYSDCVCTFGKNVLIVSDISQPSVKQPQQDKLKPENVISTFVPQNFNLAYEQVWEDDKEEKNRNNLIGKHALRRIQTDKGIIIVEQGGEITSEVVQKAKLAGKLDELYNNIE